MGTIREIYENSDESQYTNDYFNDHFTVHRDFHLCNKKQSILMEYYKKRNLWTETEDNSTNEYNAYINMLDYILSTMFGDQELFRYTVKILLESKKILVDNVCELRQDVLECITYYKDDAYTIEDEQLQTRIIDKITEIINHPNFQEIYSDDEYL
jgi:hypothetical protein